MGNSRDQQDKKPMATPFALEHWNFATSLFIGSLFYPMTIQF